jgi:hypothetical protein
LCPSSSGGSGKKNGKKDKKDEKKEEKKDEKKDESSGGKKRSLRQAGTEVEVEVDGLM